MKTRKKISQLLYNITEDNYSIARKDVASIIEEKTAQRIRKIAKQKGILSEAQLHEVKFNHIFMYLDQLLRKHASESVYATPEYRKLNNYLEEVQDLVKNL